MLPIGSGNDLCRSLGWNGTSFDVSVQSVANKIREWVSAETDYFDLWQVTLKTFDSGSISKVHNRTENQHPSEVFSRVFTNYVGIGVDARVTYTMELHRTSLIIINKILYAIVGLLYFFRPLRQLFTSIASFRDKSPRNVE